MYKRKAPTHRRGLWVFWVGEESGILPDIGAEECAVEMRVSRQLE